MPDILIATIEGEPITAHDDGRVTWRSCARIDTDGSGPMHGDPDGQSDTSLHHNGRPLNADVDRYIVVPPQIIKGVKGIVLGCQAKVTNGHTGLSTAAVVGDIGPHSKLGEISVACAKALGINPSPTRGGEDNHVVQYEIHPGIAANVQGVQYTLKPSR